MGALRRVPVSHGSQSNRQRLVRQPIDVNYSKDHHAAVVAMPIAGNGDNATSTHALRSLRDQVIPATIDKIPGVRANVGGMTAANEDFNSLMRTRAPIVF